MQMRWGLEYTNCKAATDTRIPVACCQVSVIRCVISPLIAGIFFLMFMSVAFYIGASNRPCIRGQAWWIFVI
jgi:hypothetical protein